MQIPVKDKLLFNRHEKEEQKSQTIFEKEVVEVEREIGEIIFKTKS